MSITEKQRSTERKALRNLTCEPQLLKASYLHHAPRGSLVTFDGLEYFKVKGGWQRGQDRFTGRELACMWYGWPGALVFPYRPNRAQLRAHLIAIAPHDPDACERLLALDKLT